MNQTIGLAYQVSGHKELVEANQQVSKSLLGVDNALGKLNKGFSSLARGSRQFESLTSRVNELGRAGAGIGEFSTKLDAVPASVERTAASLRTLRSEIASLNQTASRMRPLTLGGVPGGPVGPGGGLPPSGRGGGSRWSPFTGPGAGMFMARWFAFYEALRLGKAASVDVLMGRSRKEMAHALGELSAVSFDPIDKAKTEAAARTFSTKFWTVTAEQYTQAMSQTASAFDVKEVGFENLRKMNEAVLQFGMLSKMKGESAAQMMSQWTRTLLTYQSKDVRGALESGGRADVPGYGNVDLGDFSTKIVSQMTAAIEKSNIWGPGISAAARHSLPTLLNQGWDVPSALSFYGALVDVGFQPAQGGRGIKDIFTRFTTDASRAMLMGMGKWQDPLEARAAGGDAAQARLNNEMKLKALSPIVGQIMSNPESMARFLPMLGQWTKDAQGKGFRLTEDMKFSKYFLQIIQSIMKEGFQERMLKLREEIASKGIPEDMANTALATLDDAGTAWQRISTGMSNFFQTIADTKWAHRIASGLSAPFNINTAAMQMDKLIRMEKLSPDEAAKRIDDNKGFFESIYGVQNTFALRERAKISASGDFGWTKWLQWIEATSMEGISPSIGGLANWLGPKVEGWTSGSGPSELMNSASGQLQGALTTLGEIFSWLNEKAGSLNQTLGSMMPWNWFGEGGDARIGRLAGDAMAAGVDFGGPSVSFNGPEPLTQPIMPGQTAPMDPALMAGAMTEPPPIVLQNQLHIDGRMIYEWISEAIEWNRTTGYQGFGGDPMGFNSGVAGP